MDIRGTDMVITLTATADTAIIHMDTTDPIRTPITLGRHTTGPTDTAITDTTVTITTTDTKLT